MSDWYIYLIRCRDGSLYTGIAVDVARRFAAHQIGIGAKYLRGRAPLALVFQKKIGSRSMATAVEIKVKQLPKAKKEYLIRTPRTINTIVKQVNSKGLA